MSDDIEKPDEDVTETAASTEAAASAEKPKPARKPRAAKPKAAAETADEVAAEAATDEVVEAEDEVVEATEEKPKPARKPRAAKPKADEAAAEAPEAEATEAAAATEAEKTPKAEKPAAAKPAPRRGASKQPEPSRRRGAKQPEELVAAQVVRAQAKYVRSSARKARLVCDNIRGKSVTDARAILAHTPRAVARDWSKLLESAIANAENNHDLDGEDLVIKAVTADEGPTIKRFRPRAMGRATQIRKRTSHLTILLTPKS
jgi:ribosomal protein L22